MLISRMCEKYGALTSRASCNQCKEAKTCETLKTLKKIDNLSNEIIETLKENSLTFDEATDIIKECEELLGSCLLG